MKTRLFIFFAISLGALTFVVCTATSMLMWREQEYVASVFTGSLAVFSAFLLRVNCDILEVYNGREE